MNSIRLSNDYSTYFRATIMNLRNTWDHEIFYHKQSIKNYHFIKLQFKPFYARSHALNLELGLRFLRYFEKHLKLAL